MNWLRAETVSIVTQKTTSAIADMIFNGSCQGQTIGSVLTGNARKVGKIMDSMKNMKKHLELQIKEAESKGSDWVYILKSEAEKCLELAETDDVVSLDERIKMCRILFNRCYAEHGNYLCQYCTCKAVCERERDRDTKRNS